METRKQIITALEMVKEDIIALISAKEQAIYNLTTCEEGEIKFYQTRLKRIQKNYLQARKEQKNLQAQL